MNFTTSAFFSFIPKFSADNLFSTNNILDCYLVTDYDASKVNYQ